MGPVPAGDAVAAGMRAREVRILYTNYRGEKAWRRVRPRRIWFGATEWHPGEQWLMDAHDVEKGADRSFALQDIQAWEAPED